MIGNQDINSDLLQQREEQALFDAYTLVNSALTGQSSTHDYNAILLELSGLKEPLDAFFDKVMIMSDDEAVKENRIKLITNIRALFLSVADISVLNM